MDDMLSRVVRAGLIVILIAVPLIYSSQTHNSFSLPKRVFFQIAVSALLSLFALQIIIAPERLTRRGTPADLLVLAWLAWTSITALHSLDRDESMRELICAACLAGFFVLITRNVETRAQVVALLAIITAMGMAEALYGIAEWRGVKMLYESNIKELSPTSEMSAWRWSILGTFGNAYHLASYLVLVAPLLLGLAFACRGAARALSAASLIPVLACLVLTGARGSWLAAALGCMIWFMIAVRAGLRIRPVALGFALALLVLLAGLFVLAKPHTAGKLAGRVGGLFSGAREILTVYTDQGYATRVQASLSDATSSLSYRVLTWRLSLSMIAQRPLFGSGPGTFKLLFLPALAEHLRGHDPLSYWGITEKMNEPHNEFLQLAVETGVPGLIIFLMFCGVIVAAPLARAEGLPLADRLLAAAGASSLVAGLADAAASIPFHVVPTRVAFWAVAALMFPLAHRPRGIGGQQSESGRCAWRWLAAPYLVLFAGITMYYSQKELTFEYYLKAATGLALARRHDQSLPFFEMALRTMPRSGQLKFYYGSALVQMGRYAEGAAMLEDAKTNFQDVYLFKNLGIAYERMGQQERAVGEFQKWRAMGITSHEANNLIGFVRLRQGMKEEAVAAFKETLRVRPWDWIAYSSLANILIDAGRSDEAVRTLRPEPFATGKDRRPEAFTIYGVALLKAGRYAESQKYFVRTIALEPGSVTAHNNLAALYWRTGMRDDAIREWREALRLDPKNEVARKNIEAVSISEVSAPEDTTGKSPRPNVESSSREY